MLTMYATAPGKEFNSWSSDQQNNYMKPFVSYHLPFSISLNKGSAGPRSTKVIGTQPCPLPTSPFTVPVYITYTYISTDASMEQVSQSPSTNMSHV